MEKCKHDNVKGRCYTCQAEIEQTESNYVLSGGLNAMLETVKEIRKSDCGAWLKDCNGIHSCSEGREKRQELMRLLDKLYKAASTKRPEEGEKAIKELDKANDLINALYESGCLDLQREELVQEYLRG